MRAIYLLKTKGSTPFSSYSDLFSYSVTMKNYVSHLAKVLSLIALLILSQGLAQSTQARPLSNPEVRRAISSGQVVPLSVAMNRARAHTRGGEVLRAKLVQGAQGRLVYRFKMLLHGGRVMSVIVDASSGRVIGSR